MLLHGGALHLSRQTPEQLGWWSVGGYGGLHSAAVLVADAEHPIIQSIGAEAGATLLELGNQHVHIQNFRPEDPTTGITSC